MMRDGGVSTILQGGAASGFQDVTSKWIDCSRFARLGFQVLLQNPSSALQATLTFYGSNERTPTTSHSRYSLMSLGTPAVAGITLSGGVLTVNSPAASADPYGILLFLQYGSFPRHMRCRWQYTSGGFSVGTGITVIASGVSDY